MIAQVRSLFVLLLATSILSSRAEADMICRAGGICYDVSEYSYCWEREGVDPLGCSSEADASPICPMHLFLPDYPVVSCGGAPCIVDGASVPDGETRLYYKPKKNGSCISANRTCTNGVLGPPHGQFYDYYSCNACDFNDVPVNNGSSVTAYSDPHPVTGLCTSEVRQCVDGDLGGNLPNLSCAPVAAAAPCNKAGLITWHPTDSKVKWCNGSIWKDPSMGTGTSCTGVTPGKISYVSGALHYCNGTNWISMKGASLGSCTETAGKFRYVTASSHFEYCDGTQKWKMGN